MHYLKIIDCKKRKEKKISSGNHLLSERDGFLGEDFTQMRISCVLHAFSFENNDQIRF